MLPRGRFLLRRSHAIHIRGMLLVEFSSKNFCEEFEKSVLQRCLSCYAPDMTPHERCLQVLAAVVQFDDANGIILVEQAIDALIQAAGTDTCRRLWLWMN
jgi:hypothetical protein